LFQDKFADEKRVSISTNILIVKRAKKKRAIAIAIITVLIAVILSAFFFLRYNTHNFKHRDSERYKWLFTDSAWSEIDTFLCIGLIGKEDFKYNYLYNDDIIINVWEFRSLSSCSLDDISFNFNEEIGDVSFSSGEVLDDDRPHVPTICSRYGLLIRGGLNINISSSSIISDTIEGDNYKGFFGEISKMTLTTITGKHEVIFKSKKGLCTTIQLALKKRGSFFLIQMYSKSVLTLDALKILDLRPD
jgi:hypothetical protein